MSGHKTDNLPIFISYQEGIYFQMWHFSVPPDVTICSFRFSLGLKRVIFFGEVLLASSDAVHIRNSAITRRDSLAFVFEIWLPIFHTQPLLLIALMPANKTLNDAEI